MNSSEKFCLRWNDFESNISGAFRELREDKDFFDVTLACDDDQVQAHKVILSACSPFFRSILRRNRHEHPLLYLKGVKYADLVSVLNFMYQGEVNVAQEELNTFLAVAEDLQIKGLTQSTSRSKPSSSQPSGLTKPRVHNTQEKTNPVPAIKPPRPRPERPIVQPPTVNYQHHDDEIQEFLPVKSEPLPHPAQDTQSHSMNHQEQDYSTPQDQAVSTVMADPNVEYGVEEYGDYEEYSAPDGGYNAEGMNMEHDENKDLDVLIAESMSRIAVQGAYLWKCHLCEKSNKDKSIIRRHMETHFPSQNICKYCGVASKTRNSLKTHIANHHEVRNFQ